MNSPTSTIQNHEPGYSKQPSTPNTVTGDHNQQQVTDTNETDAKASSSSSMAAHADTLTFLDKPPCDKLYVRIPRNVNLSLLAEYRTIERLPHKRPYFTNPSKMGIYEFPNGARCAIYCNEKFSEIQINPSQWSSFTALKDFLKILAGDLFWKLLILSKLHLNVDLQYSTEDVHKSIRVSRTRKQTKFHEQETRRSGRAEDLNFTSNFGSTRKNTTVYNAARKHKLRGNVTRIERRDNAPSACLISHIEDFPDLLNLNPFGSVSFKQLVPTANLKKRDRERYEYLNLLIERHGQQDAIARLRAEDPKHFARNFKNVLNLNQVNIDLAGEFHRRLKKFIDAKPSDAEAQFLKALRVKQAKFSEVKTDGR